jgi:MFS family permease
VIVILAGVTLTAYGSWIYSFGVLLDDLTRDLAASEAVMVGAFGLAQLLAGAGSLLAGRALDRHGSRPVMIVGLAGTSILAGTSLANTPAMFLSTFALGAGIVGACGFYHVSQTVVSRLSPRKESKAITRLTLYAAFSAPIFYPLSGWLVDRAGWQLALQAGAGATAVFFLAAWAFAASPPTGIERTSIRLTLSGHDRRAWRFTAGVVLAAGTVQLLSVYQVPVMTSAGLALATASGLAGARGLFQFLGRLPLGFVVDRIGAATSLRWSIAMLSIGTVVLAWSGLFPIAVASMFVTGLAVGAQSPLIGIRATEVFPAATMGTSLGAVTLGTFLAGAMAPVVAGNLVTATGTRISAVIMGTVIAGLAMITVGGDA